MEIEAQHELEAGLIFDDRYLIIERVGEGGMGTVYKAKEINLERIVALKVLRSELLGDLEDRARFKTEGRILSQLIHDNVVRFYRYGIFDGKVPYIDMELLEGQNLRSFMQSKGRLPAAEAIAIVLQVCDALMATSQVGIVHRDLKPTNVILCGESQKQVKLIDFGLSHVLSSSPVAITQHLTKTGLLIGSVNYMSPEQCLGKKVDSRSDIYALGCMLYEMVSGEQPFVADNPIGLLHKHANEEPNPPVGSLPNGVVTVIANAMRKQPADRYQSFEELKHDLTLVQQGKGSQIVLRAASSNPTQRSTAATQIHPNEQGKFVLLLVLTSLLGVCLLNIPWNPFAQTAPKKVEGSVRYLQLTGARKQPYFRVQEVHLQTTDGEQIRLMGDIVVPIGMEKVPGAGWRCNLLPSGRLRSVESRHHLDDLDACSAWRQVMEFVETAYRDTWQNYRQTNKTPMVNSKQRSMSELKQTWSGLMLRDPFAQSEFAPASEEGFAPECFSNIPLPQSSKIVLVSPSRAEILLNEEVAFVDRKSITRFTLVRRPNNDEGQAWEITQIDRGIPVSEWNKY